MSTALLRAVLPHRLAAAMTAALFGLTLAVNPLTAPGSEASVSPPVGRRAVNVAANQIGIPYVWGGTSRRGFDCSGLTQYAYARVGRYIPRTVIQQYHATMHVSQRAARQGDLVFVVRGGSVPHVGIYLGYGHMIAAPHPGARVRRQWIRNQNIVFGRVR